MKLLKTTTTIGLIAVTLASCGGTKTVYVTDTEVPNSPEKTVVKTTDAPIATTPPAVWSDEDEFIADIYNSTSGTIYLEDQDMIDAGYSTCDGLRSGMSGYDVLEVILSSSDGVASVEELLTNVVASAVINFCPEQQYKFSN
jgi:hypothetical protein